MSDEFNPPFTLSPNAGGFRIKPSKPFDLFKNGDPNNKDSTFIRGLVSEHINMGGVMVSLWLMVGINDQTGETGVPRNSYEDSIGEGLLQIQDAILGENRDIRYADNAIRIKASYTVSANELDYARFGMMLNNDIVQLEFSRFDMERACNRKLITGDIIELPHLGEVGLDGKFRSRFYRVESLVRSPNGFDPIYQHHIMAATLAPVMDSQEMIDLFERETRTGNILGEILGTRSIEDQVISKVQDEAEAHSAVTWFDGTMFYIVDEDRVVPWREVDDGDPPNGKPVSAVSQFPTNAADGDYVLRVDFFPSRLYRLEGNSWVLKEIDRKREWQSYNWLPHLSRGMSRGTREDDIRPWEIKSLRDLTGPRQGRSNPAPKGDFEIIHADLRDWDRKIKIEVPEFSTSDFVSREATLVQTNTPLIVSTFLNATAGQYSNFLIYYVVKRGAGNQQVGEILINDDGTNTDIDHEFTLLGTVGVVFSVMIEGGLRRLKYTLTNGIDATMIFYVASRWA